MSNGPAANHLFLSTGKSFLEEATNAQCVPKFCQAETNMAGITNQPRNLVETRPPQVSILVIIMGQNILETRHHLSPPRVT